MGEKSKNSGFGVVYTFTVTLIVVVVIAFVHSIVAIAMSIWRWVINKRVQHNINTFDRFTGNCMQCHLLPRYRDPFIASRLLPTQITEINRSLSQLPYWEYANYSEAAPFPNNTSVPYFSVMYNMPVFICIWLIFMRTFSNFFTRPSSGDINGPMITIVFRVSFKFHCAQMSRKSQCLVCSVFVGFAFETGG